MQHVAAMALGTAVLIAVATAPSARAEQSCHRLSRASCKQTVRTANSLGAKGQAKLKT